MVRHPRAWRWSSYRATAGDEEPPPFLTLYSLGFTETGLSRWRSLSVIAKKVAEAKESEK